MHKYMHQVVKKMDQKQLYEARWMKKPRLYNIVSAPLALQLSDRCFFYLSLKLLTRTHSPARWVVLIVSIWTRTALSLTETS